MLDFIVFGIFSWTALGILIIGVLYRLINWIFPKNYTGLVSIAVVSYHWSLASRIREVLKRILLFYTLKYSDKMLFWGAFLFHWGIFLTLFIGHTALFFTPEQLTSWGISPEFRKMIALYVGSLFGIVTIVGLIILWIRRIWKKEVRAISYLDDWVTLALITIIVGLGMYNTVIVRPNYAETITPWLLNLLSGNLNTAISYIAKAELELKLHIFFAQLLMVYVPVSKMIHPFSIFFQPTITTPPYKVKGSEEGSV
ncbi:MAG: respiratory nitrate reductase subunit gamma [Pyrobaculum sp.]